jgi:hypothetical protein
MPTELVSLELEEVSLVDLGDDPLAKVALFKRVLKGEDMDNENTEDTLELEKGYKKEDMKSADKMDDMEDDEEEEMMDEEGNKKPTRKSWKAEAKSFEEVNKMLLEEIETLKGKVQELEAVAIEKAKPVEETIEISGEFVAKSAIPAPVLKKLEELQQAREGEELRKRAEEVLPNFKGTADERGKLLKSVGTDETLIAILRAADAAFAGIFQEVGKTDAENDLKTPADKLNEMVKFRQEEKKEDFYKAYAAVIKTAEGKSLLLETYKK